MHIFENNVITGRPKTASLFTNNVEMAWPQQLNLVAAVRSIVFGLADEDAFHKWRTHGVLWTLFIAQSPTLRAFVPAPGDDVSRQVSFRIPGYDDPPYRMVTNPPKKLGDMIIIEQFLPIFLFSSMQAVNVVLEAKHDGIPNGRLWATLNVGVYAELSGD